MKTKIFYAILAMFLMSLSLVSCSEESDLDNSQLETLSNKQKLMKETSLLLGNVLADRNVKEELNNALKEASKDGDIVSFAYLFDKEESLKKNELISFKSKSKNLSVFRSAMVKELNENLSNYGELSKYVSDITSNTSKNISEGLEDLLVTEELQVFYPYDPEYADDDMTVTDFYVSFDPLNGSQTNMGYKYIDESLEGEIVNDLDNDFLDENPVYIVVPIDPCDIPGQPCQYTDLQPSEVDAFTDEFLPYDDDQLFAGGGNTGGGSTGGGSTGGGNTGGGTNTPTTELLTENADHTNIPESDIISSYIPRIQINGTSWMGFGGTHQKLRFFRATTDGSVTQNADGTITAGANNYLIKYYRCKRKFVRKKYWVDINAEFDPDWNMSENTQSMAIFSVHHISASASFELTAKSGFKLDGGEIKPNAEASGTLKVNVSTGSAKFRANAEMSRRFILATIVGNGTTGQTFDDNGVKYNVKNIGIVKYYMKHFYTDLD